MTTMARFDHIDIKSNQNIILASLPHESIVWSAEVVFLLNNASLSMKAVIENWFSKVFDQRKVCLKCHGMCRIFRPSYISNSLKNSKFCFSLKNKDKSRFISTLEWECKYHCRNVAVNIFPSKQDIEHLN
jgi:hypothetical protein